MYNSMIILKGLENSYREHELINTKFWKLSITVLL